VAALRGAATSTFATRAPASSATGFNRSATALRRARGSFAWRWMAGCGVSARSRRGSPSPRRRCSRVAARGQVSHCRATLVRPSRRPPLG